MKKILFTLTILFALAFGAFAQDRFRVSAHYQDSRIPLTEKDDDDPVKGFSAEADAQLFRFGKLRASATYNFQQLYGVEVYPDYFDGMKVVDLYRDVRTHYVGAQLGISLGYRVEPFIGYFVGSNKIHEDASRQTVSKVRIGLNATFAKKSPFFVKAAIDFNRSYGSPNGGFVSPDTRMVIVGAGFQFK